VNAKRVLVTGARGFIGRHCLPALARRGFEVHAVTSSTVAGPGDARWHTADLLSPAATRALVATVRPTHALHLAWIATPGQYATALDNLRWAEAGPCLMEALIEFGTARVVATGSCAEYDWNHGVCDEQTTPLVPGTLYAAAKHAWHFAFDAMARSTLSAAWARIFLLYGPGEHPTRIVPSVIQPLLRGQPAQLSAGTQVRDLLYVKDVADALAALLDSPVAGPVNIGSGRGIAIRDLALHIARQLGRPDLLNFGEPASEPARLVASTRRLSHEVGWQPKYDLAAGLSESIAWWRRPS